MVKKAKTKTKTKAKTKVKRSNSKAIATWDEELSKMAQDTAAKEVVSTGSYISVNYQGAKFTYGDVVLEPPLNIVILESVYENAYYEGAYDPDNPQPPACFSISGERDELEPHESSPNRQNDSCSTCELNEFGSAEVGRGKACKNGRRLAIISADDLDDIENAEIVMMRLSPTSMTAYAGYVKKLASTVCRPPLGVITSLDFVEEKRGNILNPQFVEKVPNELIGQLIERKAEAEEMLMTPYDISSYGENKPEKKKKKSAKKSAPKKKKRNKF